AIENENVQLPIKEELDIYFITIGEEVNEEAVRLVNELRQQGIQVDKDYQDRSIRAQFRAANRLNANFVIVLGEEELKRNIVNVRVMESGEEKDVLIDDLVTVMKENLGG